MDIHAAGVFDLLSYRRGLGPARLTMDDTNSLIAQRKEKLAALRAQGVNPFANKFAPTDTCAGARAAYAEGREVALAGRITAHRDMGKSQFLDLKDQSGRIQLYAQKQVLGDAQFDLFKHLDLGDLIGVRGTMFTTRAGEISVKVSAFVILAKALRPPPEKWHGLEDTEIRYRQRYLDLMANDDVKRVMLQRSEIIREVRNFLHGRGFVEVETPMMQAIPGGAAAQPFKTHHNALGCDFYLRIALELYLKRLLVGGLDKVFELGRNFRNEGLSRRHNPEFTMLEVYQAYGDYETMMELVQSMIGHVALRSVKSLRVPRIRTTELKAVLFEIENDLLGDALDAISSGLPTVEEQKARETVTRLIQPIEECIAACVRDAEELHFWMTDKQRPWDIAGSALAQVRKALTVFADLKETLPNLFTHTNIPMGNLGSWANRLEELSKPEEIDLTPPWREIRYKDLVREVVFSRSNGKVTDWFALTPKQRFFYAKRVLNLDILGSIKQDLENDIESWSRTLVDSDNPGVLAATWTEIDRKLEYIARGPEDFEVTQAVFEKLIEPTLIDPTFVTHAPKELIPLAKLSPDDPSTVEVFELCINGQEIAPAYSEQNDPIEQRERLEHQAGGEHQKLDEDFMVALEHGMPPAGGMGVGIDRLCMMLLGQESIRDVILFPQLKPK